MNDNKIRGWVLAEWLIALALGAVIVAITLPNYYDAQTRSKTSQVQADLHHLETAQTAYKLDNGRWMPDVYEYVVYTTPAISVGGMNDPYLYGPLTTPVAYLNSVPQDSFQVTYHTNPSNNFPEFPYYSYYGAGWLRAASQGSENFSQDKFLGHWLFHCPGPDGNHGYGEWSMYIPEIEANGGGSPRMYDPSNGIVSMGDIVRWDNMELGLLSLQ